MNAPCTLCPRRCRAVRPSSLSEGLPAVGACRAPLTAVVSRAGLHRWEEPVISGERGSGAVFFAGCNLHCVFCQNHAISRECTGVECSAGKLREIYSRLIDRGAHNINLVTPGHFLPAILPTLEEKLPVPVVWNSNGYELPETLRLLEGKVEIFLPDLKYGDPAAARRYSRAPDYFETACAAIEEMYRQTGPFVIGDDGLMRRGVIIRHLILPGLPENTLRVIEFVARRFRPGEVMFSLMRQYLPCGEVSAERFPELDRRISEEEYRAAEDALFASGIEDGFVQDADSAEAQFIPDFSPGASDPDALPLG